MSRKQTQLGTFDPSGTQTKASSHRQVPQTGTTSSTESSNPKLGFENTDRRPAATPSGPQEAINLDYILWTGRYPYVFDAARLGYGIGHREDSSYQWSPDSVSLNTQFLDNHFQNPDLDRFVDNIFQHEPDVAVIGDVEDESTLDKHLKAADEVWSSYPDMRLILVPKCRPVLADVPEKFILGYPNGKSDIKAGDVAPPKAWRGRDLHILGGTPLQTWNEIEELTRPYLSGEDPANIIGIDSNVCLERAMNRGIYRKTSGGEARHLRDSYVNKRALVLYSLLNIKHYWWERGVWPGTDGPGRDGLPERDALLTALGATTLGEMPKQDFYTDGMDITGTPTAHPDLHTLATSPAPHSPRTETPAIRTDETQATVIEPCLPTPFGLEENHTPAGAIESISATYAQNTPHRVELICPTCGGDLAVPESCRGAPCRPPADSTPVLSAEVVSYDHKHTDSKNHFDSVAQDAPSQFDTPGNLVAFCSETCRKRGEARIEKLSPPGEAYPSGEILQRVDIYSDTM
jgi:hypothetical protein